MEGTDAFYLRNKYFNVVILKHVTFINTLFKAQLNYGTYRTVTVTPILQKHDAC